MQFLGTAEGFPDAPHHIPSILQKRKLVIHLFLFFINARGSSHRREKRKLTFQSSISKEERLGLCEMPLAHNHLDILPKSPKISFLLYGSNLRWSHFNQKTCQIWPFSPAGIQIDGTLSSSFSPVLISRLIHTPF